jgi:hypothetical protein
MWISVISTHLGFGFEPSKSFKFLYADVAELADALASGASDRKVMWVQVPSSAPRKARFYRAFFFCSSKNKWADALALRTVFN